MAANTTPIFTLTPNTSTSRPGVGITASDGSGSITTLFTAGVNGSRLDIIHVKNSQVTLATSSAMVVRIFVTDNTGSNPKLLEEVALGAATRSASVVGANTTITFPGGLLLASGQIIKCSQSIYASAADQVDFVARGGDY